MKTVAVTGANGFIGSALVSQWSARAQVRPIVRRANAALPDAVVVGDVGPQTDWTGALQGVDVVVHCAGRAHVLEETARDPIEEFRRVNRDGALALARAAVACGVRRLVFLSSIGVMGDPLRADGLITADQAPDPVQDYAVSKREAELGLERIGRETELEIVTVRPPLVYGPGAPANFRRLLTLVNSGLPLPLALVRARRSFIGMHNLADVLWACIEAPRAANRSFFVSDGEDISTADLVRRIASHMGRSTVLLPVPPELLRLAGKLAGREDDVARLLSPLRVDVGPACSTLGWRPRHTIDDELARCVAAFKADEAPI